MQNNNVKIGLYISLGVITAIALFFFWQTQNIKRDFEDYREAQNKDSLDIFFDELEVIDSLFFAGNYKQAASRYEEQLSQVPDSLQQQLKSRLDFFNAFDNYKTLAIAAKKDSGDIQKDSVAVKVKTSSSDLRQMDSMRFVLRKSRIKIQNLQRQLIQKSAGEYLTFQSGKGSQVHYVGQVKNEQANGKGLALLETGSRYEGQWKDNQRHGEGAFYWPDGEYYIGEYKNDKREGSGTYFWPNGEKYVGQWAEDKRNGKGTFYDKEGEIITNGTWKNDELVQQDK